MAPAIALPAARPKACRLEYSITCMEELSKQLLDRRPGFVMKGIGNLQGPSDRVHVFLVPVNPQGFVDGGENISQANLLLNRISSPLVTGSNDLASPQAPATHDNRPAIRP